eukprot:3558058-Pleurochrysis_carterae.AAC.1
MSHARHESADDISMYGAARVRLHTQADREWRSTGNAGREKGSEERNEWTGGGSGGEHPNESRGDARLRELIQAHSRRYARTKAVTLAKSDAR